MQSWSFLPQVLHVPPLSLTPCGREGQAPAHAAKETHQTGIKTAVWDRDALRVLVELLVHNLEEESMQGRLGAERTSISDSRRMSVPESSPNSMRALRMRVREIQQPPISDEGSRTSSSGYSAR